jgi:hypothetical protein
MAIDWHSLGLLGVRVRLRTALAIVAVTAVLLAVLVPLTKRLFFADRWNTWIVKTVKRPDGAIVRLRIRRYPERDVVHEEVLTRPDRDAAYGRPAAKSPR